MDESKAFGHRIYGTRFVDRVQFEGQPEQQLKSRLVLQGYNDKGHGLFTNAPTVQRSSQRLLLCMAPRLCEKFQEFRVYQRDVTQAYTQSETPVTRLIFAKPPKEMGLPQNKLLKIVYPLYGLTEAGALWFHTYHQHHLNRLNLENAPHDLCFLYTPALLDHVQRKTPACLTFLQTDDTLILSNNSYAEKENSTHFEYKPAIIMDEENKLKFNGMSISKQDVNFEVDTSHHVDKMQCISTTFGYKEEYVAHRARGAYISSQNRPDLSYGYAYASQFPNPNE